MDRPVTIHTSSRHVVTDSPITWRAIPEGVEAHAFRDSGPGWMRSLCKREPFSFRQRLVDDDFPRCRPCALGARTMAPESPLELAAANGDR